MKPGIHPRYEVATVVCATCGTTWQTRSTKKGGNIRTDLCSSCHPFFTGEQRIVDIAGQVDRFMKRLQLKQDANKARKADNRATAGKAEE